MKMTIQYILYTIEMDINGRTTERNTMQKRFLNEMTLIYFSPCFQDAYLLNSLLFVFERVKVFNVCVQQVGIICVCMYAYISNHKTHTRHATKNAFTKRSFLFVVLFHNLLSLSLPFSQKIIVRLLFFNPLCVKASCTLVTWFLTEISY